jgi:hypothetical protein
MNKAIFINAETREVVSVELSKENTLAECYSLIGCNIVEAIHTYSDGNCDGNQLIFDEEGLFKEGKSGFYFDGWFIYGNAIIWGNDIHGYLADCNYQVDDVLSRLYWVDKEMSESIRNSKLQKNPQVFAW